MTRRIAATLALAASALLVPWTAVAGAEVQEASAGAVRASLTFQGEGPGEWTLEALEVFRAGASAYRAAPLEVKGCSGSVCGPASNAFHGSGKSVVVRDLDGDDEPEVLVDLYSGGAHCCFVTTLLRWDGRRYVREDIEWGDPGYRLMNVDQDAEVELVSADARFAYAFSAFAFSAMPVRILALRRGRLVDVTREHPDRIRADRSAWLRRWRANRRYGAEAARGIFAAWAADGYRVDGRAKTLRSLRRRARAGTFGRRAVGLRYVRRLDRSLVRWGYAKRR
jgi:hypothetical protein